MMVAQAQQVLDDMRQLPHGQEDLPETIDPSVFEGAKEAKIDMVELEVDGVDMLAIGGITYPFADELKERGFAFQNVVNGKPGAQLWLTELEGADKGELVELFESYGFDVEIYDGVEESDAEDVEATA